MYVIVALAYLILKDPYSQIQEQSLEQRMNNMFLDISVVIFITFDRLGKTVHDLIKEAKSKIESKSE